MKIDYECETVGKLFESEIKLAINWLLNVRDEQAKGWAWVQFIAPNEQNTAEVICTLIENNKYLNDETYKSMEESIREWLINPARHAKISIDWSWVLMALLKVLKNNILSSLIAVEDISFSISQCVNWLIDNQNTDGGWADLKNDLSNTARTSLAIIALNQVVAIKNADAKIKKSIQAGIKWILSNQRIDGGWGNMRDTDIDKNYQKLVDLPYVDLKYQCNSNASCTGCAILALYDDPFAAHDSAIMKGNKYIKDTQKDYGGWEIFSEVGIRTGIKYTFRYFSTSWALRALLYTKSADYTDECILLGINYLIQLQDVYYGGWKSSPDADNYTWATCNALETIQLVKTQLSEVKAKQFLQIVCDWWNLRKKDGNFSIAIGRTTFAFNAATCLLFCMSFSIMMLLLISSAFGAIETLFLKLIIVSDNITKLAVGIVLIIGSFIMGLPWVIFVKNVFNKDMESWINSFGWVYGIITGFMLAFYQFIL